MRTIIRRFTVVSALAAVILSSTTAAFAKIKEEGEGGKNVDYATIQFLGLVLKKPMVIEGKGRGIQEARLDALQKLGKAREGKFAKVRIVTTRDTPMAESQWYWWQSAGNRSHWIPCGKRSPTKPMSPFGLKVLITENGNTCTIKIRSEPTLADLFWDVAGQKNEPNEIHPKGPARAK